MRILLVDDGGNKAKALRTYLGNDPQFSKVELVDVDTGFEARRIMRAQSFDILILDILLPWRSSDTPSAEGSLKLLDSVVEDDTLQAPRQVVGLSADVDAAAAASDRFKAYTWTVLHFDETGTSWLEALGASIVYMTLQGSKQASYETDVLVMSALRDPEMDAVHRLPWSWKPEEPLDDVTFVRRGSFMSNGTSYNVVTAVADRMGMVSAAVLATKAISLCRPRYCVMIGICAGLKDETRLGDVILADPAWDYQSGKRIKETDGTHSFKIDPHHLPVSPVIKSRVKQLALDKQLLAAIRQDRDDDPGHDLRLLPGPMATGSAVITDPDIVAEIKNHQSRKVVAIEMEAYGLALAANQAGAPKPTAFILKGVSDFADEKKDDSKQRYAAYASAKVMQAFFERYMFEIQSLAGN